MFYECVWEKSNLLTQNSNEHKFIFNNMMYVFSVDLVTGITMGHLSHDSKIDWLEVCLCLICSYLFLFRCITTWINLL